MLRRRTPWAFHTRTQDGCGGWDVRMPGTCACLERAGPSSAPGPLQRREGNADQGRVLGHRQSRAAHAVERNLGWRRMLQQGGLSSDRTSRAIDALVRKAVAQNQIVEDLFEVSRIIGGQ